MPGEWSTLVPLVEFLRYTTPRGNGLAPRDLDRAWSFASPLERELLPLTPAPSEPLTEVARKQFAEWRNVREIALAHRAKEQKRRMELANRTRISKQLHEGDIVCYRDPKMTKQVAGRAPGKRPAAGPFQVTKVVGSKIKLIPVEFQKGSAVAGPLLERGATPAPAADGKEIEAHAEQVYLVPPELQDYESQRELKLDVESAPGSRPTLGELYQSRGEQRAELRRGQRRKVQALSIGSFIAYRGELPKRCRLGCITEVFAAESRVTVHAYAAAPDQRLRATWGRSPSRPRA